MRNENLNSHDHIPITKPFLGKEEMEAIIKPLETGWIVQGPHVEEFEQKFNLFTGVKNSIASTSCTTALHMGIKALGIKPGDEVMAPFNMVSNLRAFLSALKKRGYKGLSYKSVFFPQENHLSVIPPTISRGLRFVFDQ